MQQLRKKQIYLKENNNKKYKHNINLALLDNM